MALYEKAKAAMDDKDAQAYLDLLHDDFVFVRHQTGGEVTNAEEAPTLTAMTESTALETSNERCIYENDDIIVSHQFMKFPDGTSEAVMVVNMKKDGKIIRAETGATPIK
jgi:ketosteroid isomerase-like protein